MFYSVTGKVILTEAGTVVLETGGIGYRLTVSGRTLGYAAEHSKEDAVRLFTHLSVREDALELFGFCDQSELSVFRQLISVSGVGPKAAISILTQLSPQEFVLAVMSGDYKALSRAQGIGKRIAERVILELKDKVSKEMGGSSVSEMPAVMTHTASGSTSKSDAIAALMVLGYGTAEINAALRGVDIGTMETEQIVKAALKNLR